MKNKTITVYELMGLIKDDKAPKQIKYDVNILSFDFETNNYRDNEASFLFGDYIYGQLHLDNTVEILPEEDNEWEDIEEIENIDDFAVGNLTELNSKIINKLIKNQRKIIEKLKDNTYFKSKVEFTDYIDEYLTKKLDNVKNDIVFDYWKEKVESKDE